MANTLNEAAAHKHKLKHFRWTFWGLILVIVEVCLWHDVAHGNLSQSYVCLNVSLLCTWTDMDTLNMAM